MIRKTILALFITTIAPLAVASEAGLPASVNSALSVRELPEDSFEYIC